jgi:hypothetical protein
MALSVSYVNSYMVRALPCSLLLIQSQGLHIRHSTARCNTIQICWSAYVRFRDSFKQLTRLESGYMGRTGCYEVRETWQALKTKFSCLTSHLDVVHMVTIRMRAAEPTGRRLFPGMTSSSESADCSPSPSSSGPVLIRAEAHSSAQTSATTAPTSTTPRTTSLVFALHANHPLPYSSWCAPAFPLRGHHPMAAAYAAKRPKLPSRRPHSLVASELLRAVRCQVLDAA